MSLWFGYRTPHGPLKLFCELFTLKRGEKFAEGLKMSKQKSTLDSWFVKPNASTVVSSNDDGLGSEPVHDTTVAMNSGK